MHGSGCWLNTAGKSEHSKSGPKTDPRPAGGEVAANREDPRVPGAQTGRLFKESRPSPGLAISKAAAPEQPWLPLRGRGLGATGIGGGAGNAPTAFLFGPPFGRARFFPEITGKKLPLSA